jgi:nitroreductase
MDLMEAIYSRRSVRSYSDQQVEKPMVEAPLDLGGLSGAPA